MAYDKYCIGRSHPQCLVNAGKIVIHKVEGQRVFVILHLLGKGVGQAGKPSHAHTHGEVLPLAKAG